MAEKVGLRMVLCIAAWNALQIGFSEPDTSAFQILDQPRKLNTFVPKQARPKTFEIGFVEGENSGAEGEFFRVEAKKPSGRRRDRAFGHEGVKAICRWVL